MRLTSSAIIVLIQLAASGWAFSGCGDLKPKTPEPKAVFQSFKFVSGAGPCPPDMDCSGFIELSADGTLLVDNIGELPRGTVHQIQITPSELESMRVVLTSPELRARLDEGGQDCPAIHDIWESMSLTLDGRVHAHTTTACSDEPILQARRAILALAKKYFPKYFSS